MRPSVIEVVYILAKYPPKMAFMEDEKMVQALAAHTPEESLTDRIGSWGMEGSGQHLDLAGGCQTREHGTVLAVVITDQIPRLVPKRRGLSQLLGDPCIGWMGGLTPT
jgi:hypothetical protein